MTAAAQSLAAWRAAHPRATLTEIEAAVRGRMAPVEATMIRDAAMASAAANLSATPRSQRPRCPDCAGRLSSRGRQSRVLYAERDEVIALERSYAACNSCGREFFPPR